MVGFAHGTRGFPELPLRKRIEPQSNAIQCISLPRKGPSAFNRKGTPPAAQRPFGLAPAPPAGRHCAAGRPSLHGAVLFDVIDPGEAGRVVAGEAGPVLEHHRRAALQLALRGAAVGQSTRFLTGGAAVISWLKSAEHSPASHGEVRESCADFLTGRRRDRCCGLKAAVAPPVKRRSGCR